MGKIIKLNDSLIDKIAAGEVIVRPASVVKELVENSIDAESRRIRIEISNAARDIIISDDGCGMSSEDVILSFERHATSKINTIDDLETLLTRGFRGEALASIAAVSKAEMVSRPKDSLIGYKIQIEGGKEILRENTGSPIGTTISVRSLFYNTPVRLKFLKSEISEINAIIQIITSQALSVPEIGFSFISNGKIVFDLPSGQSLKDRIISLLGQHLKDSLLEIKKDGPPISLYGFISKPEISRKDRQSEYFFIQNRPITCKTLNYCLEQAYSGLLMTKRFPVCILFLNLNPGEVDVNVHPTKAEVRFRDERLISSVVYHAVTDILKQTCLMPALQLSGKVEHSKSVLDETQDSFDKILQSKTNDSYNNKFKSQDNTSYGLFAKPEQNISPHFSYTSKTYQSDMVEQAYKRDNKDIKSNEADNISQLSLHQQIHPSPLSSEFSLNPPKGSDSPDIILESLWKGSIVPEPIGQIANTYIAASFEEHILFIDQHAAHERILYNNLKSKYHNQKRDIQPLLIPINFDIKIAEIPIITIVLPYLKEIGFEIIPFGGATYSIQSLPLDIKEIDVPLLIQDILEDMKEQKDKTELDSIRDKIITRTACRAAIKSGQHLTFDEMKTLLIQLRKIQLSFTCPHGRPTMILLTRYQLDKQFKRIV